MFRGRPGARAASAEQAVLDAQQIVRHAWELELLRQRDRLHFAVHAANQDCDTAHQRLAQAQHDGDPRAISAAHTALESALHEAHASALARDRFRATLRAERGLLARAATQGTVKSPARHPEQRGATRIARPPETPSPSVRRTRRVLRAPWRLPRWLSHPAVRRAA
jgi:hypothetical protein